ncbi:MAG: DUF167 domain-containing protein [Alphaproteobacteria bacterium]
MERNETIKLTIKVTPNSNKDEVIGEEKDLFGNKILKIKTTKIPKNGKANKAVIEILADYFKVPKNRVDIISGLSSRTKIVKIYMSK